MTSHPLPAKITLPYPCPMRIAELQNSGFHCGLCHRTVTDFRNKSREEIRAVLESNPGKVCGIYSTADVDVPPHIPVSSIGKHQGRGPLRGKIRRFLFALAAIFLPCFSLQAQASEGPNLFSAEQHTPPFTMDGETLISGKLRDNEGHKMNKVTVMLMLGDQLVASTVTDEDGFFEVKVPGDDYKPFDLTLEFEKNDIQLGIQFIHDPGAQICRIFTINSVSEAKKREKYLKHNNVVGWGT
jgi:hypothetical protein